MTAPDPVDDRLGRALVAWLAREAAAEERLLSFAFREGDPAVALAPPTSTTALRRWIAAIAAEPDVAALLALLAEGPRPVDELAAAPVLGLDRGDRIALAARLGALAACGLVARELESDRVVLTELGHAVREARA